MTENPLRQIFLSSVTSEFGEYRDLLKANLSLPYVKVQEQGDFVQGGGKLLEKLDDYIRQSDAVIHLVGEQTGHTAKPDEVRWLLAKYPDFLTRFPFLRDDLQRQPPSLSYTQLEAWLTLYHRRRCHLYRPQRLAADPIILTASHPQQQHWDWLGSLGEDHGTFEGPEHLCCRVLRDLHNLWPSEIPASKQRLIYPPLGRLFIGRESSMADLRARFEQARLAGHWPNHAVHGLGGIGKTRLAVEYAWRYQDHYTAVLMVNAESPEALDRELAALAGVLHGNLDPHLPDPDRVRATLDWLRRHSGWLLLVDNVDTEVARQAVVGRLHDWTIGHMVITGRISSWPRDVELLDLRVLAPEDAQRFLLEATAGRRRTQPDDDEQARRLAEDDLGGLCLALEQAAAYIGERNVSLAEYRRRWAANAKNVRAWADKLLMRYHEEREISLSVATTWQTTFDQLTCDARALLEMLSWLAPDPLPRELFDHPEMQTQLRNASGVAEADIEAVLAELRRYSLLSCPDDTQQNNAGQVHRLVQLVTRERLADEPRTTLSAMLAAVNVYAPTESNDVRTWPSWEPLHSHVAALIHHADRAGITTPTARLMCALATLLHSKALHCEAEPLMRRALAIAEQAYDPMHPDIPSYLNSLAELLHDTNRLIEAESLGRRALALVEQIHGTDHPDVAICLNTVGRLLQATNRLVKAEPQMVRALEISQQYYGPAHPKVAIRLNNLAQLLHDTNRLDKAEPLMRRALAIDEQFYGPEHPEVAGRLNNLAMLLQDTNRLSEAEPLFRRALAIDEQSYGREHTKVAVLLNNLALLLQATNRLSEAEQFYCRALTIAERSLGTEHPNVARYLNNLALLFQATNRLTEAEPLFRRALVITEQAFGSQHPNVAKFLNNLALLFQATNRLSDAEPLMRRAIAIGELSVDHEHPDLALWNWTLAMLLKTTSRFDEAEPLLRRAILIYSKFEITTGYKHTYAEKALKHYHELLAAMKFDESEIAQRLAPFLPQPSDSTTTP